ncbi:VVA0879 family protein [Actinomadura bangladeshensis]|uniref:Uncharacterized protein n=1 Tax=Actinomadura bangladeshensis TaxID=453573 RepID=A0A6L9QD99_9ACTN|nr:VVA0879 family protein [Actinomadura bangladeshensis]NEA22643.1 hypothetical protein [Actinomadura bangladeshensis]
MADHRKLTQAELVAEARARFGDDPLDWAFECPSCGDVATGRDFREALAEHPRKNRDGSDTIASDVLGQECIGRTVGALKGPANDTGKGQAKRGCDWCAYGFFPGPWEIILPDGRTMNGFPLADRAEKARGGGRP